MCMLTIIGGMGPDASAKFAPDQLIPALKKELGSRYHDQAVPGYNHLSRPIEDRTQALLAELEGNFELSRIVSEQLQQVLDDAYAIRSTKIAVCCNTAHAFFDGAPNRPALNLHGMELLDIRLAALSQVPEGARVGLMATSGTIEMGLYSKLSSVPLVLPSKKFIDITMRGIYDGVKWNDMKLARACFKKVVSHLARKDVRYVIAGCTEIPLALKFSPQVTLIDPVQALAKVCAEAMLK
jgi:aspartate racemase